MERKKKEMKGYKTGEKIERTTTSNGKIGKKIVKRITEKWGTKRIILALSISLSLILVVLPHRPTFAVELILAQENPEEKNIEEQQVKEGETEDKQEEKKQKEEEETKKDERETKEETKGEEKATTTEEDELESIIKELEGEQAEPTEEGEEAPVEPEVVEEEPAMPYDFAEEEEVAKIISTEGYFRTRVFFYSNIPEVGPETGGVLSYRSMNFIQSRLRIRPTINISPTLQIKGEVDMLDNIIWGEGANGKLPGEVICPQFSYEGNYSKCRGLSRVVSVKQLWGEVSGILALPITVRIGRQPVDFGLGIFFNDGEDLKGEGGGFKNLWGDTHYGTVRDRISIDLGFSENFSLLTGFDFLRSSRGELRENIVSPFIVPKIGGENFKFMVYGGAEYSTTRTQELYFALPYVYISPTFGLKIEVEGNVIGGRTSLYPQFGRIERYEVFAWNVAGRVKWETGLIVLSLDGGFASGDRDPGDGKIESVRMHPDYNAGFILFEDVLAELTGEIGRIVEDTAGKGGELYATQGGVKSAWFVMPTVGLFPFELVGTYLSVLVAFSNQNDLLYNPATGKSLFERSPKTGLLGVEIDWGLRIGTESFMFGTQLGYLIIGDALRSSLPQSKNPFKATLRFTYRF